MKKWYPLALIALLSVSLPASAGVLVDSQGDNAGWDVTIAGAATSLTVSDVDLASSTAWVSITSDFGPMVDDEMPAAVWTFNRLAGPESSVNQIIVTSDLAVNQTGIDWNGFLWRLSPSAPADLDSQLSQWTCTQLPNLTWISGDELYASGGNLSNGQTLVSGTSLVIRVDSLASDAVFSLKETAVPEPATMALFAIGAALVAARRTKARKA